MLKSLAAAVTAIAQAFMAREHNVLLRMIAENSQQIHEAKQLIYKYENGDAVDPSAHQLAQLWLSELQSQKTLLFAAAGRTAPALANPAGQVPANPGAGDQKP